MSSVVDPQPEPPHDEELVAYLDGELAPEECRAVEARLANDAEYRQQLRDLDQAWEALSALPPATVDDSFARTTIELACVAAEEDFTERKSLAAVETRSQKRWWIAGGVAAAIMGFVMVRGLAVHRNNALLADLPAISQVNALTQVSDIEFLRRLSSAVSVDELVTDRADYSRTLEDFKKVNSPSMETRQQWVESLPAEQKAEFMDRTRVFGELRHDPAEKDRLRQLANEIGRATDAEKLQATLVAYGQWLSRHTAGDQQQLTDDLSGLSLDEKVSLISKKVHREDEQAARHLSADDVQKLREEIFTFAKAKRPELLERLQGRERERIAAEDVTSFYQALLVMMHALRTDENADVIIDRMISKLSPEANAQWQKVSRGRRDLRKLQLGVWIYDARERKGEPENLERFFVSNKLSNDKRQELLEMDRAKMEAELKRLYLGSEIGVEDRLQFLRDFGDGRRGPRGPDGGPGPPPHDGRRGDGPPWPPEGPPLGGERFGPGGPPDRRFERDPRPGGPRPDDNGPGGPRPDERFRRRPGDGPPDGPPRGQQPPLPPRRDNSI